MRTFPAAVASTGPAMTSPLRGICRKLVQERTLAAAADDVKSRDRAPGELLDLVERRAVRERQAFQNAAGELARSFRRGLAGLTAIGRDMLPACRRVSRIAPHSD